MAKVVASVERVEIRLSKQEMNTLLIQPAKDAGYIDFEPTRVAIREDPGGWLLTFERSEGESPV